MSDNFFEEIANNTFEPTRKKFSEIFTIEKTQLGIQVTTLSPVRIGNLDLHPGKILINQDIKFGDKSILDMQNSELIGETHTDNGVFYITGYED